MAAHTKFRTVPPVGKSTHLSRKPLIGALHLAQPAAAQQDVPLCEVGPVDQHHVDARAVEPAGGEIFGPERVVIEEAIDVEIVDRQV